ncbi:MAG: amidohydrolase family protein [Nakamurella sp.]
MSSTLLLSAGVPGMGVCDVRTTDGLVTQIGSLSPLPGDELHDLSGYLLLPGLVEPHVHLDKIFSAPCELTTGAPPLSGLRDAIDRHESVNEQAAGPDAREFASISSGADSVAERAERALHRYLANGTTAVRCHVGCGRAIDAASLRAVLAVRERMRGLIEVQIVADIGWPRGIQWSEHSQSLRPALRAGADLIGGYPSLEGDPEEAIDACLAVAREHRCGVDFHLDEAMDPDEQDVRYLARRVRADPHVGPVTASHCVSLGCCEPAVQREIAAEIADAGISVITNPMTNLYLQDRPAAQFRGLTAIQALADAGVTIAAGSDNVQDAFNPVGRCDPLEVASLLVTAAQCEVGDAFAMVSTAARAVLGLPPAGPRIGAVADLLAVRCDSVTAAVASASADRMVFTAGRLVARSRLDTWVAEPMTGEASADPRLHRTTRVDKEHHR